MHANPVVFVCERSLPSFGEGACVICFKDCRDFGGGWGMGVVGLTHREVVGRSNTRYPERDQHGWEIHGRR